MTNINYHTDVWILGFVEARITEDEVAATAATAGPWVVGHARIWQRAVGPGEVELFAALGSRAWLPDADHVARHNPQRVLAECAAKRALIEAVQDHAGDEWEADPLHRTVILTLAAAYSDHPDYEQDWAL